MSGSDESQSEREDDEQGFDAGAWHQYLGEDGYEGAVHSQQQEDEDEEMGEEDPEDEE